MNNLLKELEALKITGNLSDESLWSRSIELIQKTFVPRKSVGADRPCEEKDFREFRLVVDRNLQNIRSMLHHVLQSQHDRNTSIDLNLPIVKTFTINLLLLIGEEHEKNNWNTAESVFITQELKCGICKLLNCASISQILSQTNNMNTVLLSLRPKLMKDTWKTYPAAVSCYKWILEEAEKPLLFDFINDVIPTALIILDDYIPDNVLIGLECINRIVQHCAMRRGLIESGYADVIYHAMERLAHERNPNYVVPLYSCVASLLATIEYCDVSLNVLEWTKRDDVLAVLFDNMELEQNLDLRHAYMQSLPQLLTNIGCAKWCERLTRILVEYCEHHTDLRTLKATLMTAKIFLQMFHLRVAAHCVSLYTAFLKLHFDLTETPVFDKEIIQNLEDCICLLYQLTPTIGSSIMRNDKMRSVIKSNLLLGWAGDTKYFD